MEPFSSQIPHLEQLRLQNIEKNQAFLRSLFASQLPDDNVVNSDDQMQVDEFADSSETNYADLLQNLGEELQFRGTILNDLAESLCMTQLVENDSGVIMLCGPHGVGKSTLISKFLDIMLPSNYIPVNCAFYSEQYDIIACIQAEIVKFFRSKWRSTKDMAFWKAIKSHRTIEDLVSFLQISTNESTEIILFIDHLDSVYSSSSREMLLRQLLQLRHLSHRPKLTILVTALTTPTDPAIAMNCHIISVPAYSNEEMLQLMTSKRSSNRIWATLCQEVTPIFTAHMSSYPAIYSGLCSVWTLCTGQPIVAVDSTTTSLPSNRVRKAALLLIQHNCFNLSLQDSRYHLLVELLNPQKSVASNKIAPVDTISNCAPVPIHEQVLIVAAFLCTQHLKKEDSYYDPRAMQLSGKRKKRRKNSLDEDGDNSQSTTVASTQQNEKKYERLFTAERLLMKYDVIIRQVKEKASSSPPVPLLSLIGRLVAQGLLTVVPNNRNVQQWVNQVQYKSNISFAMAKRAAESVGFNSLDDQLKRDVHERFKRW